MKKWGNRPAVRVWHLEDVEVVGLALEALPMLTLALEEESGEWVKLDDGYCAWIWMGFVYLIGTNPDEGWLCRVEKIGRVDTDDEGEDVFVDFRPARRREQYATWGEF